MPPRLLLPAFALLPLLLAGCDNIPGLGPDPRIAQREAEAKAIGGGCRHGLRSIEDCYTLNPRAAKAAVFAGWKEMDQYMRENKIEGQASNVPKEEVIEEDKSVASSKDKAGADPKAKPAPKAKAS
jgi:hypothetical protein